MLGRYELYKMPSECFIVFSLLFVDDLFYFLNFFLIVTHDSPLNCLLLPFELTYHFLSGLHLVPLLLQIHINLHVLFVNPSHEGSLHKGFSLDLWDLNKVFFILKFRGMSKIHLLFQDLDTWRVLCLAYLIYFIIISAGLIVVQIRRLKLCRASTATT